MNLRTILWTFMLVLLASFVMGGTITGGLVYPTGNLTVEVNKTFQITTSVTCTGSTCNNVVAKLDPQPTSGSNVHIDSEVYDSLSTDGVANVIIEFDESSLDKSPRKVGIASASYSKTNRLEAIDKVQNDFLGSINGVTVGISSASSNLDKKFNPVKTFEMTPGFAGEVDAELLDRIAAYEGVKAVYIDGTSHIMINTSMDLVNASAAWNLDYKGLDLTGEGQTVCVIDTGIRSTHLGFENRVLAEKCYCTASEGANANCCAGNLAESGDATDNHGHGSHCAGIIAGNGGSHVGVAPNAGIVAVKVANSSGSLSNSDMYAAIDWCVANADTYNISVISMSLGGGGPYSSYCSADPANSHINAAVAAGIPVVVASGNEAMTDGIASPACVENVTSVGAVYKKDYGFVNQQVCIDTTTGANEVICFTNRHSILDMLAPGGVIWSYYYTTDTVVAGMSGTSMATPHVAGLYALYKEFYNKTYNYNIQPWEIEEKVKLAGLPVWDEDTAQIYPTMNIQNMFPKGVIPEFASWNGVDPFYTTSSNPATGGCLGTMNPGDVCNSTWTVNATDLGTFEFFTIYEENETVVLTPKFNVTVVASLPSENSVPTLSGLVIDADTNQTDENVYCNFSIYDADADTMNLTIQWYKDGLINATVQENTDLTNGTAYSDFIPSSWTSVGDNWSCKVQITDGENTSQWYVSENLTIVAAPIVGEVPDLSEFSFSAESSMNYTNESLLCSAIMVDNDPGAVINATLQIYRNGTPYGNTFQYNKPNGTVISFPIGSANTNADELWNCTGYAWSSEGNSSIYASDGVVIQALLVLNSAPVGSNLKIDGMRDNFTDELISCTMDVSDADGDNYNQSTRWYLNGILNLSIDYNGSYFIATIAEDLLDAEKTSIGDNWSCAMRVSDGKGMSPWYYSDNLTIKDQPTYVTDFDFFSEGGNNYTSEDLYCYGNITDVESRDVTFAFDWYKNGVLNRTISSGLDFNSSSRIGTVIDYSNTSIGDNWSCVLVPALYGMPRINGTPQRSVNITILDNEVSNNLPFVVNLSILSVGGNNYSNEAINGFGVLQDVDLDNITYYLRWYANGTPTNSEYFYASTIRSNGTSFGTASGPYSAGTNVSFSVIPYDGKSNGTEVFSENLTVLEIPFNLPPHASDVYIFPFTNLTSDNLNCSVGVYDDNGDAFNASVRWYRNGVLEFSFELNNSFNNGDILSHVLESTNTSVGEEWNCAVRLNDSINASAWHSSVNVTILSADTAPYLVDFMINSTPGNLTATSGDSIWCNGTLVDNDGDLMNVTVEVWKNNMIFSALYYNWELSNGTVFNRSIDVDNYDFYTGDEIYCSYTVESTNLSSVRYFTPFNVTIYNIARPNQVPSVAGWNISGEGNNYTTEDLTCSGILVDNDLDKMNVTVGLFVNGSFVNYTYFNNSYANESAFSYTIGSQETEAGSNYSCSIMINDSRNASQWYSSGNLTVVDVVDPYLVNFSLISKLGPSYNYSDVDLHCDAVVVDPAGFNVTAEVNFYVNGILNKTFGAHGIGGSALSGTSIAYVLSRDNLVPGDNWTCDMKPIAFRGPNVNGSVWVSNNLTIRGCVDSDNDVVCDLRDSCVGQNQTNLLTGACIANSMLLEINGCHWYSYNASGTVVNQTTCSDLDTECASYLPVNNTCDGSGSVVNGICGSEVSYMNSATSCGEDGVTYYECDGSGLDSDVASFVSNFKCDGAGSCVEGETVGVIEGDCNAAQACSGPSTSTNVSDFSCVACTDSDSDNICDDVDECVGEGLLNIPSNVSCTYYELNATGCHVPLYQNSSYVCNSSFGTDYECSDGEGLGKDVFLQSVVQYCGDGTGVCDGDLGYKADYTLHDNCSAYESCQDNVSLCADITDPILAINGNLDNQVFNVSHLRFGIIINVSEPVNLSYSTENLTMKTICTDCSVFNGSLGMFKYGNNMYKFRAVDNGGNTDTVYLNLTFNLDTDGDGVTDDLDVDLDNDGVNDTVDEIIGNETNVDTNFENLSIEINASTNLSRIINDTVPVVIKEDNDTIVEFDFDFTNSTIVLPNVSIEKQENSSNLGAIIVRGIDLVSQSQTKTVYIDRVNTSYEGVCIRDNITYSLDEMSADCNLSGEYKVECDGTAQDGYTCTVDGLRYRISGLHHSAVKQLDYTVPAVVVPPVTKKSSGGSGSSGGSAILPKKPACSDGIDNDGDKYIDMNDPGCSSADDDDEYNCVESWNCGAWSDCIDGKERLTCFDENSCGTRDNEPVTQRDCTNEITGAAMLETCSDGIQNQDETGVDCGGVCPPCYTSEGATDNEVAAGKWYEKYDFSWLIIFGVVALVMVILVEAAIYRKHFETEHALEVQRIQDVKAEKELAEHINRKIVHVGYNHRQKIILYKWIVKVYPMLSDKNKQKLKSKILRFYKSIRRI